MTLTVHSYPVNGDGSERHAGDSVTVGTVLFDTFLALCHREPSPLSPLSRRYASPEGFAFWGRFRSRMAARIRRMPASLGRSWGSR